MNALVCFLEGFSLFQHFPIFISQQNVGILSNIVNNIGTEDDGPLLQKQLKVQIDVIRQLGTKIETNLKELEQKLQSMPRAEAAENRATHIKLTRDYHWVETKYKNVQLEAKQSMQRKEMQMRLQAEENGRRQEGVEAENHRLQMQMQLQDDRVTEEIMKEREEEVRKINHGMHQVNEIYKDLANIVSYQQDQVDEVEVHMENANKNAESGLKQLEKAKAKQDQNCIIS